MRKLFISKWANKRIIAVVENGYTAELIVCLEKKQEKMGAIYLGKVKRYHRELSAYFIDLGHNKEGFLQASDVLSAQLAQGEQIIVQVTQVSRSFKSVKLTMNLTFPGQYVVYAPYSGYVAASKNMTNKERANWLTYGNSLIEKSEGLILRTAAINAAKSAVQAEFLQLRQRAKLLIEKKVTTEAPVQLFPGFDCIDRCLHDYTVKRIDEIWTDDEQIHREMKTKLNTMNDSELAIPLYIAKHFPQSFDFVSEMEQALKRVVWLQNGSYLLIEETETATFIDVNSGKSTDDVITNNEQAAKEVARQIRLRNLEGMILIDFLRMSSADSKLKIKRLLEKSIQNDLRTVQLFGFTQMGLFELTRKKTTGSLSETVAQIDTSTDS